MTEPKRFEFYFGQPVWISHYLRRITEYRQVSAGYAYGARRDRWKTWQPVKLFGQRAGIVIGIRTLANGKAEHEYEAGTVWYPADAERFTAYLVAYDFHKKPVYVLPEFIAERKFVDSEHEER
jgi:hypothetical protein